MLTISLLNCDVLMYAIALYWVLVYQGNVCYQICIHHITLNLHTCIALYIIMLMLIVTLCFVSCFACAILYSRVRYSMRAC
jgi:hypothetical protein